VGLLVVVGLPGSGKAVGLLDGDAGPLDLDSAGPPPGGGLRG